MMSPPALSFEPLRSPPLILVYMINMVFSCRPGTGFAAIPAVIFVLLLLAWAPPLAARDRLRLGNSPDRLNPRQENPLSSDASGLGGPTPLYDPQGRQGPPSWAQEPFEKTIEHLKPFGANLFTGNFARTYYDSLNPGYEINAGDRIAVKLWGAKDLDTVLVVDQQGNIFLPEVGPVKVAGLPQSSLNEAVRAHLATIFTSDLEVYVNLMNAQPVAVYVTGFVNKPGRYAGGPTESPLYYLDMAGGINISQGSYRHLIVKRGQTVIAAMDLYDFILEGRRPDLRLRDGDTIVVGKKGVAVAATGRLPEPAFFELTDRHSSGADLIRYASPLNSVTHVSVAGVRDLAPFRSYMPLDDFYTFQLDDNDSVEFHADAAIDFIMVSVQGAARDGAIRHTIRKGVSLAEFLRYVPVDVSTADWNSVYLRRPKVAEQQRKAILESLRQLERSALTATSGSVDEADIRVREAELIQNFVKRASGVRPNGTVVVSHRGRLNDMPLEDGDIVVIPEKSGLVMVTGEVMMPNAVSWSDKMKLSDYINGAGGYTARADRDNILTVKPNGEVGPVDKLGIGAGDRLIIMPSYDHKDMQFFKDLSQIVYQIAIAAGVAIDLIRD